MDRYASIVIATRQLELRREAEQQRWARRDLLRTDAQPIERRPVDRSLCPEPAS